MTKLTKFEKIWPYLFGAICGVIFSKFQRNPSLFDGVTENLVFINYVLLGIVGILLIMGITFSFQLKSLYKQDLHNEDEDNRDVLLNKKYCDMNLLANSSLIVAILNTSILFLEGSDNRLLLFSIILLIASIIFIFFAYSHVKYVYPERTYPNPFDSDAQQKVFNLMDEGEKHVMLEGLYNLYTHINFGLIAVIALAVAFSFLTGTSQIFTITLLSITFFIVNTIYLVSVRKKY